MTKQAGTAAGQRRDLRQREELSKLLGAGAAGRNFRAIAEIENETTVEFLRGDHMVEIDGVRPMHAQKAGWVKTRGEFAQAKMDQKLLLVRMNLSVDVARLEPDDVADQHRKQAVTIANENTCEWCLTGRESMTSALDSRHVCSIRNAQPAADTLERMCEPFAAERFEQIVERVEFKGRQRVSVVSSGKDHFGLMVDCLQDLQ